MRDQAYTEITLAKELYKSDFSAHPSLYIPANKQQIITDALLRSRNGFDTPLNIKVNKISKKNVYSFVEFSDELLLRKVNSNIKVNSKSKQQDRDGIIYNLIQFIREGVPYRIYKFDIKEFYESFNPISVLELLKDETAISNPTIRILKTLLQEFNSIGVKGLPRGLSISAALAEFQMSYFDKCLKNKVEVFYYSRFVDDIIVITSGVEDKTNFKNSLATLLPTGMTLNNKKQYNKRLETIKYGNPHPANQCLAEFDYLGYNIKIHNPNDKSGNVNLRYREISVDIASKKINKIKSRIVYSLLEYCKDLDFNLLTDRIKLLAGNYSVVDTKKNIKRKSGIYYSYKHVTQNSTALKELDKYLVKMVLSNIGKVCLKLNALLNKSQKRTLLKITFSNGFNNRVFYHFSPTRLSAIMRAWKHE